MLVMLSTSIVIIIGTRHYYSYCTTMHSQLLWWVKHTYSEHAYVGKIQWNNLTLIGRQTNNSKSTLDTQQYIT